QRCSFSDAELSAVNETRFYLKPGQAVVDPASGRPMLNAFESAAAITVTQNAPYPPDAEIAAAEPAPEPAADDAVGRFLACLSNDCAGCDLSGADLRRRNLSGADLSGAILVATNLHRAVLRETKLAGAN